MAENHSIIDEKKGEYELEGLISGDDTSKTYDNARDVEKQQPAAEHHVSTRAKLIYLGSYFLLNMFLTLSNKSVLGKAKLPWLLTAAHATATSLGCFIMLACGAIKLTSLDKGNNLVLLAFSTLFTLNIAASNISLGMVSVPFHQVVRSTTPAVTIILYRLAGRTYSTQTYLTMIPLISGVALATLGDYYFSLAGLIMTLLGVVTASVKTIATNKLMTGTLKLPALELLLRLSPLAATQCIAIAILVGEADELRSVIAAGESLGTTFGAALLCNATAAFLLNVVSFEANKRAGALTMTVCGNVKQVLTILLGIVMFHMQVGVVNAAGMMIATLGVVWYGKVELDNKRAATQPR